MEILRKLSEKQSKRKSISEQEPNIDNSTGLTRRAFLRRADVAAGAAVVAGSIADTVLYEMPKLDRADKIDKDLGKRNPNVRYVTRDLGPASPIGGGGNFTVSGYEVEGNIPE